MPIFPIYGIFLFQKSTGRSMTKFPFNNFQDLTKDFFLKGVNDIIANATNTSHMPIFSKDLRPTSWHPCKIIAEINCWLVGKLNLWERPLCRTKVTAPFLNEFSAWSAAPWRSNTTICFKSH